MSRAILALPLAALLVSAPGATVLELTERVHTRSASTSQGSQDWCEDVGRNNDRETFCEVRDLKESGASRLELLDNANGSINVTGTSGRDIVIQARVVTSAESAADARALARDVSVTLNNGRVQATGPRNLRRQSWWISYRVDVPSNFDLSLETANGSVAVTGVKGRIDTESSNGSLRLTDVGGRVNARTSNGSVHVALNGRRWDGEGLTVTTSNGSARVDLPEGYNARLVAGTSNGNMTLDVPVTVQGRISKNIDTTLGSGGPTIEVRTSNGSLRVGRR
jgi:DUF4097 and DUF4098 domain-containing protein YvlB